MRHRMGGALKHPIVGTASTQTHGNEGNFARDTILVKDQRRKQSQLKPYYPRGSHKSVTKKFRSNFKAKFDHCLKDNKIIALEDSPSDNVKKPRKEKGKGKIQNPVQMQNYFAASRGKETVFLEEVCGDELVSSLEKERRVAQFLVGMADTINSIPWSPEPEPDTPILFKEEEEKARIEPITSETLDLNVIFDVNVKEY